MTTWAEHDATLRQRGGPKLWVSEKAVEQWKAAARRTHRMLDLGRPNSVRVA